ncbi:hypothetical protein LASUN_22920 [Lentilactobacillus sunkii]|jgi:hypothetical protein|uniref:Uncharacterized protein n=1 Tax=Lentilactobacillus sunkii TaxID=481719 RepID=A0A1E7X9Q4_9LACO|nr:hypothetical protein [Lentilactobacillus sunkii]OFA09810.1 hypothetical protein LASUN_22920 [Lentilactobacillus sunkii]
MNTRSKYRLILLFSMMVFGGVGMSSQANADTNETTATVQVQSKATTTVSPTSGVAAKASSVTNTAKDDTADTLKTNDNSNSSVKTTYGDAKNNQVKPTNNNDTTDSQTTAKDDSSSDATATSSDDTQEPQVTSDATEDTADETSDKEEDKSGSTTITSVNAGTSVVGANDDTINKVVKTVVDKVTDDSDKTDSEDDSATPAPTAEAPADNAVVLESPDSANPNKVEETLIVPNQPIIESRVHNDISGDTFADKLSKSDSKAIKAVATASNSKTKLLTFNAFSDKIYSHVLKTAQKPGKVTTVTGRKVTLTTPVKHVKYMDHDTTGISETLPIMVTLAVIAVSGVTFFAFDPLKFLFK